MPSVINEASLIVFLSRNRARLLLKKEDPTTTHTHTQKDQNKRTRAEIIGCSVLCTRGMAIWREYLRTCLLFMQVGMHASSCNGAIARACLCNQEHVHPHALCICCEFLTYFPVWRTKGFKWVERSNEQRKQQQKVNNQQEPEVHKAYFRLSNIQARYKPDRGWAHVGYFAINMGVDTVDNLCPSLLQPTSP